MSRSSRRPRCRSKRKSKMAKERELDDANRRLTTPEAERWIGRKIPCLDHGFIYLVDYMGGDASIVQAARVSYGLGTKSVSEDRGLIRYLMRNQHTTPFEMVELKFHVKLPIFVARQWIRHRTACITGEAELIFDLPGAERRGRRQCHRVILENGYRLTMTKDHRCLTEQGWMTLGEATGLRQRDDGGVTWHGTAPALAVNGVLAHRDPAWLGEQRRRGLDVSAIAQNAGVSYHTVRKYLARYRLQFDSHWKHHSPGPRPERKRK